MRALALEHLPSNPVGVFGEVLVERGIGLDRVRLHEGERVPGWADYDLIVVMGAGAGVWEEDEYPWISEEKRVVREAVLAGIPYFGVCFGAQLLADVVGAESFRGPEPELGVNQVFLTPAADHDPVFRGFPADLEVFEWHSNHFSLPPGALRLARSPRYENQAFRYGRVAYGIQCHLETSVQDISDWFERFPETPLVFERRHGRGAMARMLADYEQFVPFLQETARQLFGRWLQHATALGAFRQTLAAGAAANPRGLRSPGLVGRDAELARIDAAIISAKRGESAVLVLRGPAGVGKTSLLDAAADRARELHVLRTVGYEAGVSEHPFAALADLCRPIDQYRRLLAPARADAMAAILDPGLDTAIHDRFAVYAAAFDLLVAAADQTPLLLVVDDAHLLDDASREAIDFIARRLGSDGISVLLATESEDQPAIVEDLRIGGLDSRAALALLEHRWPRALAPAVAAAIAATAAGNPLALVEIPANLSPAERAGEVAIEKPLPASAEWAFLSRISALPESARKVLIVAALAAPSERAAVPVAWRTLGLDEGAVQTALASGVVSGRENNLTFAHPLSRLAVSYSALRSDRRAAHAALAAATSGDSRTWHRARAAAHPDESIASDLAQIAQRARDRTAFAAAAATFERAARLTPDRDMRAQRLLEAARAAYLAGHVNAALDHVEAALRHAVAEPTRLEAKHVRGRVLTRSGAAEVARDQLIAAANGCDSTQAGLAAEILADAVLPSLRAGDPRQAVSIARHAAQLSRAAARTNAPKDLRLSVQITLGTALIFVGEYQEGVARLDDAEERADQVSGQQLAYLGAGLGLAGRYANARMLLERVIHDVRATGAISVLPYALIRLAGVDLDTGRWTAATATLHEALGLARETGQAADVGLALGALGWLAGARGLANECHSFIAEARMLADRLGGGSHLDRAGMAVGLLELGCGRPDRAIPYLQATRQLQDEQGWSDAARTPHVSPDLVEAYAQAGRLEEARAALEHFALDAESTQRPSALAALARCRALLAPENELHEMFAAARDVAVGACGPFDQARLEFSYGVRLIDAGRAADAVQAFGIATTAFEHLGADSWAQRSREYISSAGGSPPPPKRRLTERLTPLELEVAVAAAEGGSPMEIAERLFLGPRTVRMQLASATIKLGLDTPAELSELLRAASVDVGALA